MSVITGITYLTYGNVILSFCHPLYGVFLYLSGPRTTCIDFAELNEHRTNIWNYISRQIH